MSTRDRTGLERILEGNVASSAGKSRSGLNHASMRAKPLDSRNQDLFRRILMLLAST